MKCRPGWLVGGATDCQLCAWCGWACRASGFDERIKAGAGLQPRPQTPKPAIKFKVGGSWPAGSVALCRPWGDGWESREPTCNKSENWLSNWICRHAATHYCNALHLAPRAAAFRCLRLPRRGEWSCTRRRRWSAGPTLPRCWPPSRWAVVAGPSATCLGAAIDDASWPWLGCACTNCLSAAGKTRMEQQTQSTQSIRESSRALLALPCRRGRGSGRSARMPRQRPTARRTSSLGPARCPTSRCRLSSRGASRHGRAYECRLHCLWGGARDCADTCVL